ncbi:MAG TPA: hypothetical protein VMG12_08990 [Polyangiaceae bacterium]|nr:hypothetical protein [Polyangiaceae bacterium]
MDNRAARVLEEEEPEAEASGTAGAAGSANPAPATTGGVEEPAPSGDVGSVGAAGAAGEGAEGEGAVGGGAGVGGSSPASANPQAPVPPDNGVPVVCGEQLLANGDFDAGDDARWTVTSDARATLLSRADPALAASGVTPQSGDYLVWLGGVPNGEYGLKYATRIAQSVTIPANATRLTFSGYVWVTQPEPDLPLIDWAVMEFFDPSAPATEEYQGLWQVALWNEDNVTAGWVPFEVVKTMDLENMRGRTLTLVADSRPDGNGTLNVWLDSLRLEARCE